MLINTKVAIAAVMILSTAVTASAATRKNKIANRQNALHAHAAVPRSPPALDPNSPAATGGGSIGYNQNLYNDW